MAFTGQLFTHFMHLIHNGLSRIGSSGSSADVNTEEKRTLGPSCGVRRVLFTPKFPRPARYAAWRCEKKATGLSLRTLIDPYPSRGIQTEGYPSDVRKVAIRYPSWSSRALTVR